MITFLLFLCIFHPTYCYPDDVSICVVRKSNNLSDMVEWLDYHRNIGVKKVYLFDDKNSVPIHSSIADYLDPGFVHYETVVGDGSDKTFAMTPQGLAYKACIEQFCATNKWIAFLDSDEFIQLSSNFPNVSMFVNQYTDAAVIYLNWVVLSSGNLTQRPEGGVLSNYINCLPKTHQTSFAVKPIGNCNYITGAITPHQLTYNASRLGAINSNGDSALVSEPYILNPQHGNASIYYYMYKSRDEAMLAIREGSRSDMLKSLSYYNEIELAAKEECLALKSFAARIFNESSKSISPLSYNQSMLSRWHELTASSFPNPFKISDNPARSICPGNLPSNSHDIKFPQ